ncbi:MAG: hypothetical protein GX440_07535 [Propionibacterium sp.]|nr:hypothetical protein [Propionibacterium sp.]
MDRGLDPSIALNLLENALRDLMEHAYAEQWGPSWLDKVSTQKQREVWADRAQAERDRIRKGVAAVSPVGLQYSNLYDLTAIAEKNWQPLASALGKSKDCLPLLRRADSLRNTVAHNRLLVAHERDLLSGIAGQIRNQVTIYMSNHDPAGDIYPRIEKLADSFGRIIRPSLDSPPSLTAEQVLHPGDVVEFTCFGTDPQDRSLAWELWKPKVRQPVPRATTNAGEEACLEWVVSEDDVQERCWIDIRMSAVGARHHRNGSLDGSGVFVYIVRPPRGAW